MSTTQYLSTQSKSPRSYQVVPWYGGTTGPDRILWSTQVSGSLLLGEYQVVDYRRPFHEVATDVHRGIAFESVPEPLHTGGRVTPERPQ